MVYLLQPTPDNILYTSEILTNTTFFKEIPSQCRETFAPLIPEKRERRLMPPRNMSFTIERRYATVSAWNELPNNLYISVRIIPPPLMWFLGNSKSISTSLGSNGATLFLPTQTKFNFQYSSSTYCWTLRVHLVGVVKKWENGKLVGGWTSRRIENI